MCGRPHRQCSTPTYNEKRSSAGQSEAAMLEQYVQMFEAAQQVSVYTKYDRMQRTNHRSVQNDLQKMLSVGGPTLEADINGRRTAREPSTSLCDWKADAASSLS